MLKFLNINFYKKSAASLAIVFLIISGVLSPQKPAQAIWGDWIGGPSQAVSTVEQLEDDAADQAFNGGVMTHDVYSDSWMTEQDIDKWTQRALKVAWQILKRQMLNMLVDDIILWINGGGEPRIVKDWQGFLRKAVDDAGGQFVEQYLGLGFLCQRFQPRIQIALATVPTFTQRATCTLSQIQGNIEDFYNNFTSGGWTNWLTINQTQNNVYGVYLTALNEKIGVEGTAAQNAQNQGVSGSGFLGEDRCVESYTVNVIDNVSVVSDTEINNPPLRREELAPNERCTKWTSYTPGKIAAEATVQAVGSDMEWLIAADEWQEYLGAIFDAIVNRAFREGVIYLQTSGGSSDAANAGPGINSTPTVTVNISSYQSASQNVGPAGATVEQLELFRQNLNDYLGQLQTNLGILNQIRAAYLAPLNTLSQMIQAGCPLPAGVTQTPTGTTQTSDCATVCPCTIVTTDNSTINSPVGSMTQQRITTQQNGELILDAAGSICTAPVPPSASPCVSGCTISNTITYNTTNLPATPIDGEIANVTNQINTVNDKLAQIDPAISNTNAYIPTANNYISLYQQAQQNQATQAQVDAAETTMLAAQNQAISAVQAAVNSTSIYFQALLQQTQNASMQVIQNTTNARMQRGAISQCDFVQPDTYYATLCNVQATQTNYTAAYDACVATQTTTGQCLEKNTYVLTPQGNKKISELKTDDKVYNFNSNLQTIEEDSIIDVSHRSISYYGNKYYYIYYQQGPQEEQLIKATFNHKFYVNGQYAMARDLKVGDKFLDSQLNQRQITKIDIVKNYVDEVWDIDTQKNHNFFAQDILVQGDGLNAPQN